MPTVKYRMCLSPEERNTLLSLVSKGTASARAIMHANILLAADENNPGGKKSEMEIAKLFHVNQQTVHSIRKRYAKHGLAAAVDRKKRETPPVEPKITGDVEAKIIALSCSSPPEGRSRWSLRLLADKAVELNYIDSISHEAVARLLKKTNLSLICVNAGVFLPNRMLLLWLAWKISWIYTSSHLIRLIRLCVWMKSRISYWMT